MKILVVCQYYSPEQFLINEIAPELVKRGHEVTVITGLPNYPKGDVYEGYENGQRRDEIIDGVRVLRTNITPRKHDPIHLIFNYLSFASKGKAAAKRLEGDFDVVICYQLSPVTMLEPAVEYAKRHKVPVLCYCLDLWPESAQGILKTDKGLIYGYIKSISKKLYSKCDRIVVTSRPFIDYFEEVIGIEAKKLSYIPQHAPSDCLKLDLSAEDNGIVDFMYAGNMGKGQTLDVIVRAVEELKDLDGFIVHMVGDGSERENLEALVRECGLEDKFIFYGNQKREDMPQFYKKADALLITLRGNNRVGDTMPGKLQTYMTMKKPIFGAINGAASEVISESCCGVAVSAGDSIGLSRIMADYIDNPEKYRDCGACAAEYFINHFTFEKYMSRIEEEIEETIRNYEFKND